MALSIVVANLQSGIGVTKGYRQYLTHGWRYVFPHHGHAAARAGTRMKSEGVDIALFTEVAADEGRFQSAAKVTTLGNTIGLSHASFFKTRAHGQSVREGSAILSRTPITQDRTHRLPGGTIPRVMGETLITTDEGSITACVTHLALGRRERLLQVEAIATLLKERAGPLVIGGDFNERDHASFEAFKAIGLTGITLPSYPSWKPRHALQALFVSKHFTVESVRTIADERFSDHLPLFVSLSLTHHL